MSKGAELQRSGMTPKATFPTSPVPRATASSRASRTATEPPRSLESCEDAADRALHPRRVPRAFFTSHVGGVRPPEGCQKRRNPNPSPVNRERAGVCLAVARQQSTPRPRHAPSCQAPTKARPHQRPTGPPRQRRRTPHAPRRAHITLARNLRHPQRRRSRWYRSHGREIGAPAVPMFVLLPYMEVPQ